MKAQSHMVVDKEAVNEKETLSTKRWQKKNELGFDFIVFVRFDWFRTC